MQHMKRDEPVYVIRSPLRGIARAWISDNPTIGYATPRAPALAVQQAAERRRYIAERARAFATMAAEQHRLDAIEQQLQREIEARIEQLWLELRLECEAVAGVGGEARETARRELSLQVLLALLVIGETQMFLERYRREDVPVTAARVRELEHHAGALAQVIARLPPSPCDAAEIT
jgi:hypothetical protein